MAADWYRHWRENKWNTTSDDDHSFVQRSWSVCVQWHWRSHCFLMTWRQSSNHGSTLKTRCAILEKKQQIVCTPHCLISFFPTLNSFEVDNVFHNSLKSVIVYFATCFYEVVTYPALSPKCLMKQLLIGRISRASTCDMLTVKLSSRWLVHHSSPTRESKTGDSTLGALLKRSLPGAWVLKHIDQIQRCSQSQH